MSTTTAFTFKVRVHLFNGYASEAEGFAVVKTDDRGKFTEETVVALIQLANVLRPIAKRLQSNGYVLTDGRFVKKKEEVKV